MKPPSPKTRSLLIHPFPKRPILLFLLFFFMKRFMLNDKELTAVSGSGLLFGIGAATVPFGEAGAAAIGALVWVFS